jgi:hypothetical protein
MRYGKAGTGAPPYPGTWLNAGTEAGDMLDGKIYHQTPFINPPSNSLDDHQGMNATLGRRAQGETLTKATNKTTPETAERQMQYGH